MAGCFLLYYSSLKKKRQDNAMSDVSVFATPIGVPSEADTGRAQAPLVPTRPMHTGWQTPLARALPLPSSSDVENTSDNWLSQQQQQRQQQHTRGHLPSNKDQARSVAPPASNQAPVAQPVARQVNPHLPDYKDQCRPIPPLTSAAAALPTQRNADNNSDSEEEEGSGWP